MRQAETRQTIPSTAKALWQQQQTCQHKPKSSGPKQPSSARPTPKCHRQAQSDKPEYTLWPTAGAHNPSLYRTVTRTTEGGQEMLPPSPPPNFHAPNVSHRSDSDLTYRRLHAARVPAQGHHTGRCLTPRNRKANAPTSVSFTGFLRSQALGSPPLLPDAHLGASSLSQMTPIRVTKTKTN